MSDLLEDFEHFFRSMELVEELYRDYMPDSPDNVVAAYEYQGPASPPKVAGFARQVQIVVRDIMATNAKVKARELHKALVTEDNIINLTDDRWGVIQLHGVPFKMKVDEGKRVYYCFNLSIITYED